MGGGMDFSQMMAGMGGMEEWEEWAACLIWGPWASVATARMKTTKTCQTSSQLVKKRRTRSEAKELGFAVASAIYLPEAWAELWLTLLGSGRSRIDEPHISTPRTAGPVLLPFCSQQDKLSLCGPIWGHI